MKDYIKLIQRRLTRQGIKQSRSVLRNAVTELGFDYKNLADDVHVTNLLLEKFQATKEEAIEVTQTEPIQDTVLVTETHTVTDTQKDAPYNSEHVFSPQYTTEDVLTPPETLLSSEEVEESGIVVSEGEKHDLITSQASVYGIELSEVEVLELASNVGDKFTDYADFVQETKQIIKSYADNRYDSLLRQIEDTSENLRNHFEHRERQLNQKLATGLEEINTFFRAQSAKRKELSKVIAAAFKT